MALAVNCAWLSGLRLVVQHAVSNEGLCALMVDTGFQPARWGCADMLNIDRQLVEIREMVLTGATAVRMSLFPNIPKSCSRVEFV